MIFRRRVDGTLRTGTTAAPICAIPLLLAATACGPSDRPPGDPDSAAPQTGVVTTRLYGRGAECQPVEPPPAPATSATRCPGPGGYALLLADHDGRATLTVVDADGREHPLDAAGAADHAGESRFRDTAEWHTRPRGRATVPTALIVTHVAVRPDGPRNSAGERLDVLVAKIAGETCITDRIPASPEAGAEARRLAATAAARPCLRAE